MDCRNVLPTERHTYGVTYGRSGGTVSLQAHQDVLSTLGYAEVLFLGRAFRSPHIAIDISARCALACLFFLIIFTSIHLFTPLIVSDFTTFEH